MKKRMITIAAGALALAAVAFAGDVWKDKPYESWDQKDLQKILNDSPWVQKEVMAGGGSPMGDMGDSAGGGGGQRGMGAAGRPTNNDPSGSEAGNAGMMGGQLEYDARWVSSRTLREAYARAAQLKGNSSEEVTKSVTTVPATYQVVLISRDLRAFQTAGADELKQTIFLETKKTHQKVAPSKVVIVPDGDTKRAAYLVIEFPKKTDTGQETLPIDEKGTDLVAEAGKLKLKFHFDFLKMADKQGTDL